MLRMMNPTQQPPCLSSAGDGGVPSEGRLEPSQGSLGRIGCRAKASHDQIAANMHCSQPSLAALVCQACALGILLHC